MKNATIEAYREGETLDPDQISEMIRLATAGEVLGEIADIFGIGSEARNTPGVILTNARNALRRSQCLRRVEAEYFTTPVPGDVSNCALSWADEPEEYEKNFGKALNDLERDGLRFRAGLTAMLAEDETFMTACEQYATVNEIDGAPTLEQLRALVDAGMAAQEGS